MNNKNTLDSTSKKQQHSTSKNSHCFLQKKVLNLITRVYRCIHLTIRAQEYEENDNLGGVQNGICL